MAQTQLSKDIKAINQRIADFHKQGLTESKEYKSLINKVKMIGQYTSKVTITTDKQGRQTVNTERANSFGTTKTGLPRLKNTKKYDAKQVAKISKLVAGSLTQGTAKENVRQYLERNKIKPAQGQTESELIRETAEELANIHEFIDEHKNDIYDIEQYAYSRKHNLIRRKKNLTESEVNNLINNFDKLKERARLGQERVAKEHAEEKKD